MGSIADIRDSASRADRGPFADISQPEGALVNARWPAALAFAGAALADEDFWQHISDIAGGRATSAVIAGAYAHRHVAKARLTDLFEETASVGPDRTRQLVRLYGRVGLISTFTAAQVPPGLPRNAVQQRAHIRHRQGALLIMRRGAGRCLFCAEKLQATSHVITAVDDRKWHVPRDHCEACLRLLTELEKHGFSAKRRTREAIDGVLDELATSDPVESRASRRRRRRAAP